MLKAANSGASTTSRSVVDSVKGDEDGMRAIASETADILDLGLMTIAGRIAAKPATAPEGQGELFALGRPKEFTDLRVSEGKSSAAKRVRSANITLEQWLSQPKRAAASTANHRTNEDVLDGYFSKMKDEGLSEQTTLGQYLGIE